MNLDDLLPKEPKKPANTIFSYADGSANLYFITNDFLEYAPMTPERSSSGMYSGGDPAKIALNEEQFNVLKTVFEIASEELNDHIPNRIKMSGNICFEQEGLSYNLAPNSTSQKAVELVLKNILKNA